MKHGMFGTRFYYIWANMKKRCLSKNNPQYKNYGKRGILVCTEWLNFINFKVNLYDSYLEHVKKFGEKQTTIDRIDNNLGYSPDNVRWATRKEQNDNQRDRLDQRQFIAVSPEGVQYTSNNQRAFCREHALHQGAITSCLNHPYKSKSHKGWTFKYV